MLIHVCCLHFSNVAENSLLESWVKSSSYKVISNKALSSQHQSVLLIVLYHSYVIVIQWCRDYHLKLTMFLKCYCVTYTSCVWNWSLTSSTSSDTASCMCSMSSADSSQVSTSSSVIWYVSRLTSMSTSVSVLLTSSVSPDKPCTATHSAAVNCSSQYNVRENVKRYDCASFPTCKISVRVSQTFCVFVCFRRQVKHVYVQNSNIMAGEETCMMCCKW